jgi:hypothetical protein
MLWNQVLLASRGLLDLELIFKEVYSGPYLS